MQTRGIDQILASGGFNAVADFGNLFPTYQKIFLGKLTLINQLGILY
jgi:hypothetical protein